jgi:putative toxin-antitoxin system antitoxin component (TIGR02293 family)
MAPAFRHEARLSAGGSDDAASFWSPPRARGAASTCSLDEFVDSVLDAPGVVLFDAVEAGVPTYMVDVIADATRQPASAVMEFIGVSATTFKRKDEASEPLPDVAGHRVMSFLRIVATLRRMLDESGDAQAMAKFDLNAWLAAWMRQPLAELRGKTPAELLRNPEGLRAVEQVLERMRGGLAA